MAKKYQVIITLDEDGSLEISAPKDNIILVIGMIEMAKDAALRSKTANKVANKRAVAGGITIPPMSLKFPPPKS